MRLEIEQGHLSPETGEEVGSGFAVRTAAVEAGEVEQVRLRFPAGAVMGLYRYDREGRFLGCTEVQGSPIFYAFDRECRYRLSTPAWTEAHVALEDFFVEAESGAWVSEVRFQSGAVLAGNGEGLDLRGEDGGAVALGALRFHPNALPAELRGEGLYQEGAPLLRGDAECRAVRVMSKARYAALEAAGSLRNDTLYFVG